MVLGQRQLICLKDTIKPYKNRYLPSVYFLDFNVKTGYIILVFKIIKIGKCMSGSKYNLELMQEIAGKNGGKCLSNVFERPENNYLWKCEKGHVFVASCDGAKKYWCTKCNSLKAKDNFN